MATCYQQFGIPCLVEEVLPAPNLVKLSDCLHLGEELTQQHVTASGKQNIEVIVLVTPTVAFIR